MTTQPITWTYRVDYQHGRWYILTQDGDTAGDPRGYVNENDARNAIYQLDKAR